jgi:rare lipoprotein A
MKSYIQDQHLKFLIDKYLFFTIATAVLMQGCGLKEQNVDPKIYQGVSSKSEPTMKPYTINGKTYYPTTVNTRDTFSGTASWYGKDFHGRRTSNGEIYDMYKMTAAHKTFPMNTMVKVINTKNNKSAIVRINDRGPFVQSRIIDLSYAAALAVDMINSGTTSVRLEILGFGKDEASKQSVTISDFDVQIGAFRKQNGAQIYETAFNNQNKNYKAIIREGILDGALIYRVWIQGFRSEEEARDFISQGKYEGAFIVREK